MSAARTNPRMSRADRLAEAHAAIADLRVLMIENQAKSDVTAAQTGAVLTSLSGTVGEVKNQVDDLRNGIRGVGDRKGLVERMGAVEMLLEERVSSLERILERVVEQPKRTLDTLGVWAGVFAALLALVVAIVTWTRGTP